MEEFIEELRKYHEEAFKLKESSQHETDLMSIENKITKGYVLTKLSAHFFQDTDYYGDSCFTSVRLSFFSKDKSKFKVGDPIRIIRNEIEFSGMVITEINENNITVERAFDPYSWSHISNNNLNGTDGWQIHSDIIDMRRTFEKCTSFLSNNTNKTNDIFNTLYKSNTPKISQNKISHPVLPLNDSQLEAFNKARNSDYYIIQGPPGTGKTRVLSELALSFAKEGKSVLITGPTNTSINNALERTAKINETDIPIVKIWSRKNKQEVKRLEKWNVQNVNSFSDSSMPEGYIVGSTCFHVYTKRINKFSEWDVVIFDESSQLTIPLSLLPMSKSKKWIFVGDHKQLPPIQETYSELFKMSVFEKLHTKFSGTMLSETYRMHKNINRFPSKSFYNGNLISNIHKNLNITSKFTKYSEILDINKAEVVVKHNHTFYPSRSSFEAELISDLIKGYFDNNISLESISIISPFITQVKEIKDSLKRHFTKNQIKSVFIDTIERMQGQENDIVIISYGVSDPEKDKLRLSYLFNLQRFNVAITRSKMKRIFIASKRVFDINYENPNVNKLTSVFKSFLEDSYVIDLSENKDDDFDVFN